MIISDLQKKRRNEMRAQFFLKIDMKGQLCNLGKELYTVYMKFHEFEIADLLGDLLLVLSMSSISLSAW